MADKPIHETTTEARAGDGSPISRYVLIASLLLVVVLFTVVVASGWIA